ncbi:cannabinoid receptor type 1A-like [Dendronephthya gigantea]|uniref:cannabinoid receptor type 1A-like n=1 Tax=Dendronephthya gigantea TaxID=151771 RepID=UPI00106D5961|nr:cannabinoid receptor type 1A-like [Dendronephthya gigantea]
MDLLNIIIVSIGVLGTASNGALLLIFLINPLKTFNSTSTYFIKSLTVADFVTCLMTIIWGFESAPSEGFLRTYYFIFWMSIQISFYLIFFMSVERYIAVHYPLKKQLIVTKPRTLACIFIVCSFAAILAGISEIKTIRNYVRFSVFSLFDVIVICIFIVYIRIILSLRKISRETRSNLSISTRGLRLERIRDERQLLIVVFVMLTILAVTVLPYTFASQLLLVDRLFFKGWSIDKKVLVKFLKYFFPVEVVNFAVNPIIYAIRLPNYRRSLLALVCSSRRETNQETTQP